MNVSMASEAAAAAPNASLVLDVALSEDGRYCVVNDTFVLLDLWHNAYLARDLINNCFKLMSSSSSSQMAILSSQQKPPTYTASAADGADYYYQMQVVLIVEIVHFCVFLLVVMICLLFYKYCSYHKIVRRAKRHYNTQIVRYIQKNSRKRSTDAFVA